MERQSSSLQLSQGDCKTIERGIKVKQVEGNIITQQYFDSDKCHKEQDSAKNVVFEVFEMQCTIVDELSCCLSWLQQKVLLKKDVSKYWDGLYATSGDGQGHAKKCFRALGWANRRASRRPPIESYHSSCNQQSHLV